MDRTIFSVFTQLEKNHFIKIGNQIVKSFENRMNYYEAFLTDWSVWDDTYNFVEDLNEEYKSSNLTGSVLEDIGLSAILFFDDHMNLKHSFYKNELKHDISELAADIGKNRKKITEIAVTGQSDFFMQTETSAKRFLCVIAPIVPSNEDKPMRGFMVMTALFDKNLVEKLSELTGYELTYHTDVDSTEHQGGDFTRVSKQISHSLKYSDHNTVYQDFFLYDLNDKKILAIRLEQDRAFNTHMKNVLKNSMLTLAVSGLFTIILVGFILDKLVLSELRMKIQRFREIEQSNDISLRLDETGARELKELAQAANGALDRIEILNDQIIAMSNIDSLTGIANRKFFDEQYLLHYKNAAREDKLISILMIDIDYFKDYNDAYGHLAGDQCLRSVAEIINNSLKRPIDVAARYGGEEFIVMLYDTNEEGALHIAESIRKNVQSAVKPHKASKCADCITVSIGTATSKPSRMSSSIDLIANADKALYEAKVSGRNSTRQFS
jgi:diguanylate cyclase (GGDEF)-like protein